MNRQGAKDAKFYAFDIRINAFLGALGAFAVHAFDFQKLTQIQDIGLKHSNSVLSAANLLQNNFLTMDGTSPIFFFMMHFTLTTALVIHKAAWHGCAVAEGGFY